MSQTSTALPCEYVGDTLNVPVTVTDSSGTAIDISGGQLDITFKVTLSDTTELYTQNVTVFDDAVNGIHNIVIPNTATQSWPSQSALFYDIVYTSSTGTVDTFQFGTITMLKPVHNNP